jgi:hypothetical protein
MGPLRGRENSRMAAGKRTSPRPACCSNHPSPFLNPSSQALTVAGGRHRDGETVENRKTGMFQSPRYCQGPLPERITKNVLRRAVDVNRTVTPWCVPDAVRATRARTVTGELTSPARLVAVGRIQRTKSGVLNTISPSQPRSPEFSPVCSQDSRELQRHSATGGWGWFPSVSPCARNALGRALTFCGGKEVALFIDVFEPQ